MSLKKSQEEWSGSINNKEKWIIAFVLFLILIIAWAEYRLIGISHTLPFEYSLFFLGLVNFNVILFLLLLFLIFRNIFKSFNKKEKGPFGSSLKSKLIASFVGFSFIPTGIMFIVSVFYINNTFEKWFNQKVSDVLKSSIEVSNSYYQDAKLRNYHFARLIAKELLENPERDFKNFLLSNLNRYRIDSIQYYGSIDDPPVDVFSEKFVKDTEPPLATLDFLTKGLNEKSEASLIQPFAQGNLIRVIVPLSKTMSKGVLVVSSYIPMSLVSKIEDITIVYEELQSSSSIQYPMKSMYLIVLILITLVILLGATWAGFYLAKQLTVSLYRIGKAAQRVAKGHYQTLNLKTGSPEINQLVSNFNIMIKDLKESQNRIAQVERSAAWQEVAKRMAHEVKNPLTPISLAAQRLDRKFGNQITDQAFRECTKMIIDQVNNIKSLVNEFSEFARLPVAKMTRAPLEACIQDVIFMFQQAHKEIEFNLIKNCKEIRAVYIDTNQIKRVFANLIDNSVAALAQQEEKRIDIEIEQDDGAKIIKIHIKDTGCGLLSSQFNKVFEPYVTNKPTGTGLGLAIVQKTIEEHGGKVYFMDSKVGAHLIVELPYLEDL